MTDQTPRTHTGHRDGERKQYAKGFAAGQAEARTEALDVEVLARAAFRAGLNHLDAEWEETVRVIAAEYRAILAGETER